MSPHPRAWTRLARWLGPWADPGRVPPGIVRDSLMVEGGRGGEPPFEAWLYRPRGPIRGALLLLPGLHRAGPADPRLDRFARVLSDAGILTLAPFLPDYLELLVRPSVIDQADRALFCLAEQRALRGRRPGVLSISFGSLPALRLAAKRSSELSGVIVFGGYASFADTIRFSLEGGAGQSRDPLNRPAVYLNLLDHLEGAPRDRRALVEAFHAYVDATWGRPEMKERDRYGPVARRLAETLPDDSRALFLQGCGLSDGGLDDCLAALEQMAALTSALDPRPHLASIRCRVYVVHGRDDDVIPHTQAQALMAALPSSVHAKLYLTGLYGHSGHAGLTSLLRSAPDALREARAMVSILSAIADVACRGMAQ